MGLEAAEDDALLLRVAESDHALYKELEEEGEKEKQEEEYPPRVDKMRRRRPRLHRMDIACLAVVGLVACIVTVRQPALRTENPLLLPAMKKAPAPAPTLPGFVSYADVDVGEHRAYEATYEARGFEVDGHSTLLLGTDFPYARAAPETWESLLLQAKHDGNNVVAIDVEWRHHEPARGVFRLESGVNLTRAYELAARVGVLVHVRFHPRSCVLTADTAAAADDEITDIHEWKEEVERFVTVMVAVSRPFLASNGGPIIMAELASRACASAGGIAQWTGDMISLLNTSTPWITTDAGMVDYALLGCNDTRDCERFAVDQFQRNQALPLVWTRPRSDGSQSASQLAYPIARWFAIGGAAYIDHTTEEMLGNATDSWRQVTRLHLSKLRLVLQQCSGTLTSNALVVEDIDYSSLRPKWQRALVFGARLEDQVVFLENADDSAARVAFHGALYDLAAKSVVIVRNGAVMFNTSDVRAALEATSGYQDATDADASAMAVGR